MRVWGSGYDHRRTPLGYGFDPHQEGRHILPGWVPRPSAHNSFPFFRSGTPSSLSSLNHVIHTRTHAHIHAHLRSHTPKPHTSDLSIYAPRYH